MLNYIKYTPQNESVIMKKIIILTSLLLLVIIQASAFVHVVEKGETLESIASIYDIPKAVLIKANPGCDKRLYIGQKIQIPMVEDQPQAQPKTEQAKTIQPVTQPKAQQTTIPTYQNQENQQNNGVVDIEPRNTDLTNLPGYEFCMQISYGFLSNEEGTEGTSFAYAITVGINYYPFIKGKGLFVGGRIGYNSANYICWSSIPGYGYETSKRETHLISLPINAGYSFTNENKTLGISPYLGFQFDVSVKSTEKLKGVVDRKEKYKAGKFGISLNLGAAIRLYDFNITAFYALPLTKWEKNYFGEDGYFNVGIGFGF